MTVDRQFTFGPIRFDPRTGELWHGHSVAKLTPRAAALLCALAERAQRLVTKRELFDRVWLAGGQRRRVGILHPGLRGALDDARQPRIETSHRRGYRLLLPTSSPRPKQR
jgi:DNA-binding winged helix-turn-helix (wHTH) protein